jgi:hypothetical protein
MPISSICTDIFIQSISDYHVTDDIHTIIKNPYLSGSLEHLLYQKNWIDTVQWHLEDIIRNPIIDPVEALIIKRKIDTSNQERTDMVEYIDSFFLNKYKNVVPNADATINTESPAWAIDRLSILALKIFHMQMEVNRANATEAHKKACSDKLIILVEQQKDLSSAIDDLLDDIGSGKKYMKVYKQMKMYNDPGLNPILYQQQTK